MHSWVSKLYRIMGKLPESIDQAVCGRTAILRRLLIPAAVWHHRMMTSTAVDLARAGLAWDHRTTARTGTTPPCRTDAPAAGRCHEVPATLGEYLKGMRTGKGGPKSGPPFAVELKTRPTTPEQ
ncbi:hypothetical protein GCM10027610_112850 [Dactylosporangium cerinum]